ncbi:MAG: hypothetical protein JXR77_16875 [Lentisphaeria bacterium]|nr:hypothetical protein [Lentisphaeria bacterium]
MRTARGTLMAMVAAAMLFGSGAMAGYNFYVTGIKVSISCPGEAYYDGWDDTVTVSPWFDWCTIKVTGTTTGTAIWGGYCDVFILADGTIVKSISMKGTRDTWFYTVGQTYHCDAFKVSNTNVGFTDGYGVDVGLGMNSATLWGWPYPTISLKYGVCFAGCLANVYFTKDGGKSLDEVLPAEGLKILNP